MKAVAEKAKPKQPQLINSTKLRKYIAMKCQVIDMTNTELDWLENDLGHNTDIHRGFYRLQESTVELAKVSKLLVAVDEGTAKFTGRKLDDISINGIFC